MKTLEYLIKANSSDFVTAVTKAETIYGQALKGMADKAKQISLFKQAKDEADSTGTALVKLKTTAEQVRKALGDSGGSLQQSQQLAKAEAAISKTEAAMRGQVAAVVSMRQALAAAGVDTRNLAAEQDKMASAIAKASASVIQNRRTNAARDVLGIRSELDITREINLVQAAYDRLAATGTVSHNELDRAATRPRPGLPPCARNCVAVPRRSSCLQPHLHRSTRCAALVPPGMSWASAPSWISPAKSARCRQRMTASQPPVRSPITSWTGPLLRPRPGLRPCARNCAVVPKKSSCLPRPLHPSTRHSAQVLPVTSWASAPRPISSVKSSRCRLHSHA
jgi:hypothetical protein